MIQLRSNKPQRKKKSTAAVCLGVAGSRSYFKQDVIFHRVFKHGIRQRLDTEPWLRPDQRPTYFTPVKRVDSAGGAVVNQDVSGPVTGRTAQQ